ncbi:adenine deaminase C-terminal domain-containing protein [Nitritalea halalkaliphila]|uniref:adenine deaminase C-terminal domain-containing protein n=1 Tax=Nitritalea halalkaliphila TaxID=590849 RepID=UPI0002F6DC33|nr:adenine deaminase C-terminal domain-containing protein [Nitritalea halalkaliphila]
MVEDLKNFLHLATYIQGEKVAEKGQTLLPSYPETPINNFSIGPKKVEDFHLPAAGTRVRVITALDGQLITPESSGDILVEEGLAQANVAADILKIAVVNRYAEAPVAMAFVKNFGLKAGAIASTVAHDSHNIIAVGVDDASICDAVNLLIQEKGGISAVNGEEKQVLGLPVAGLMCCEDGYSVAQAYTQIDAQAKRMGAQLQAPFMTLSFMALLVIPDLKLSDKGLFDGQAFTFKDLFLS